ncbi:diacylglycerol acyltransferase-domain-containing protein [Xylariaceae sp. FL0255]|nr:diacylglycerol acyltransferase-domain-containing protein [Xylariaceae sp. FL0255]
MAEDSSAVQLNRTTINRPLAPRHFYLTPRKSSGPIPTISTPEPTLEADKDSITAHERSHQREHQITGQERTGPPSPRSPSSPLYKLSKRASGEKISRGTEDDTEDYFLESPTKHKTNRIGAPTTVPTTSELSSLSPKAPGIRGNVPRQVYKKKSAPRLIPEANMGVQVDTRPEPSDPLARESQQDFVKVNASESMNMHEGLPKDDHSTVSSDMSPTLNGSKTHGSPSSSGHLALGSGSYASVLKSGLSSDDDRNDDESYPDLDEMGMEEIHQPPPPKANGGVRWAPWNVPLKRRGQTLVLLLHSLSIVAMVSVFFAFCANPFAWPLLLLYLLHVLSSKAATDGSLKYRVEWFRRSFIWTFFVDYFPARLHKTHDLPPTRKYIFGYHPHGIISHGAWAAFATDALGFSQKFPGITNSLLTLDSNFRIPFYREYVLSMGVRSVSKESIVNILTKGGPNGEGMGRAVTVVVGGARESLEAHPGTFRLILKERKGFIKLAVRCGADLVPVLAFGENDLYDQVRTQEHPMMHRIQMFFLKVWKFTLPFLHGRGIFNYDVGLMPYRRPLNVVVGAPIKVRQSSSVSSEEVNRLHELYVAELEKLWERYKDEFLPNRKEDIQILS